MTLEYSLLIIGGCSMAFMIYHIHLVLAQEFSEEDTSVKDPLAYAVSPTIAFNKFNENSWRGFEALWAAIQFRSFYKRYTPLLSPRDAKISGFVMLCLFINVIVFAQLAKANPEVNSIIGATTTAINLLWFVIIEHGKILKKSVEKLRVT